MTNIVIKYVELVSSLLHSSLGGFSLVESEHNQTYRSHSLLPLYVLRAAACAVE